jgi:hypothetical protein
MTTNKEFNVLLILILFGSVIHARSKFDSYTPWSLFGTTEKDDIQKTFPTIPELQKKLFQPKENWFENYLESKLNDIWEKKELQQLKPSFTSTNSKNFGNFLAYKYNNIVPPWVRI